MIALVRRSLLFLGAAFAPLVTAPALAADAAPDAETKCADGVDNDGDGFVDCEDEDCLQTPECALSEALHCDDGIDNDDDGLTDCEQDVCLDSYEACWTQMCSDTDTIDGVFYGVVQLGDGTLGSIHCEVRLGVTTCRTKGIGPNGNPQLEIGPPLCGGDKK